MKRLSCRVVVIFVLMVFVGCSTRGNPKWSGEVTLPAPSSSVRGKKVVVSQVVASIYSFNVTGSSFMESMVVHDIASRLAKELENIGIPARILPNAERSDLQPDEVLIRGNIEATGLPETGTAFVAGCITLSLLPSPIRIVYGAKIKYRLEIIDSAGKFLLQSQEQEVTGTYEERFVLAYDVDKLYAPARLTKELMPPKIAKALATHLR